MKKTAYHYMGLHSTVKPKDRKKVRVTPKVRPLKALDKPYKPKYHNPNAKATTGQGCWILNTAANKIILNPVRIDKQ